MNAVDILSDSFSRIDEALHAVLDGIDPAHLAVRLDPEANTVAWLLWHIARVEDAQIAPLAGTEEVWHTGGWAKRFGLALPEGDTGYAHGPDAVAAVLADPATLAGYYGAAADATKAFLATLTDDALDEVIDERWDPPVTLGVRLVSIVEDDLQHVGQAAILRGIIERRAATGPGTASA